MGQDRQTEKVSRQYSASPQLLECYRLAAAAVPSEEARELICARLEQMKEPSFASRGGSRGKTIRQSMSEILCAFTLEAEGEQGEVFPLQRQVNELPEGAEKEYFLALLALRKGRDMSRRREARRHITSALALAGGDPRYRILAEVLEEIDR